VKEVRRLIAAFGHACEGLKYAFPHPAFRIELPGSLGLGILWGSI